MIRVCPICSSSSSRPVLSHPYFPIFQLLRAEITPSSDLFAPLEIVRCSSCGHIYNSAYTRESGERMYRSERLSNVPVHISMSQNLERIAEWIGYHQYEGKHVIEVGAGSGHLARIIARKARSVVIFEPSTGICAEMVPETNIMLINEPFESSQLKVPADLIVCRQVMEHVADPLALLLEMHAALAADGRLYIEVPRAEYIEEHAALFDLHCSHMHYFYEHNLLMLAAKAGFAVERQSRLKEGHDFGVMLHQKRDALDSPPVSTISMPGDLSERIEHRRSQMRDFLSMIPGEVALYGATWHGVAFLNFFQSDRVFAAVLDDNTDYEGYSLYSHEQVIPIHQPTAQILSKVDTVLITAYLHDRVIEEKLRAISFTGRVHSIMDRKQFVI